MSLRKNKSKVDTISDDLATSSRIEADPSPSVSYDRSNYVSALDKLDISPENSDSEDARYAGIVKKRKRKKRIIVTLCVILSISLIGAGAAFGYLAYLNSKINDKVDDATRNALSAVDSPSSPFYMLLIGTDGSAARASSGEFSGDSWRSDSLILTRIDPKEKKVSMVSLPRDLQIQNMTWDGKNYGTQKLNAAHAFGGPACTISTVSSIAGVKISHYAEINFDGFEAAVNAVGGVDVNVGVEINDPHTGVYVPAGEQHLDGAQALSLSRSRHTYDYIGDGDALRTANQRQVLAALAKKVLASDITTIVNTINTLVEYVDTDMNVTDILGVAKSLQGMDQNNIYTASMPKTSAYQDGISYDFVYQDQWKEMINRMNQGLSPSATDEVDPETGIVIANSSDSSSSSGRSKHVAASIAVRNGSGISGVASKAVTAIKGDGYTNVEAGSADTFDYGNTLILYKDTTYKTDAEEIASVLGLGTPQIADETFIMAGDIVVVLGSDYNPS